MWRDRVHAGQQLAAALAQYHAARPLVLGLPRGGVVVAAEIARLLAGDLDVLLVKKLRAPGEPELAIGAVCEEGRAYLNQDVLAVTGADQRYVQVEIKERLAEMDGQHRLYRQVKKRVPVTKRTVIVVDDGLATGATMTAAVEALSVAGPARIVVAVPVSPPDTIVRFRQMPSVRDVVCLQTPFWFGGVGQFYEDFRQVSDEEVVAVLGRFF